MDVEGELTRLLNAYNYRNRVVAKREVLTTLQHYRGLRLQNGESVTSEGGG